MKIVIAGGGTAGHVNPGIALAQELATEEVVFIGTSRGAEASLIPAAGFTLETIDVRGWDRARPASFPATAARAVGAVLRARRLLAAHRPQVVVGMGGYVSLPVCLAARMRRIPFVLHEQNVVFGLANRVCRRWAHAVAVSFRDSLSAAGPKGVLTGNPIATHLASYDRVEARPAAMERFGLDPGRKTVLVFGGSQGARRLNEATVGIRSIWDSRSDVQVLHITGRTWSADSDDTGGSLIYRAVQFVDRMSDAYAVADIGICRGGATTFAELGVVGLPAIIIPYPHHRDRQQERHGRILEQAGAAVVILDRDASAEAVATAAGGLLEDDGKLASMREAASALGRPEAAAELARVVRKAAA